MPITMAMITATSIMMSVVVISWFVVVDCCWDSEAVMTEAMVSVEDIQYEFDPSKVATILCMPVLWGVYSAANFP